MEGVESLANLESSVNLDNEYYEGLLNYERLSLDSYSYGFTVGDIVVDAAKNSFSEISEYSEFREYSENSQAFEEMNVVENHEVIQNEVVNEIVENHEVIQNEIINEIVENYEVIQNEVVNEIVENYEVIQNEAVNEITENHQVINEIIEGSHSVSSNEVNINNYSKTKSSPVTVNFNAYNEFNSYSESGLGTGADVDSVMTAFSERLAEAVASATEGVHL
jgi:hypothetical protein